MSSSKGNVSRTRRQKYQNRTVFKNDLHDTSGKTKFINSIQPCGVCPRCTDIIQWKIKYKKYKPLTAMKKCVKCEQKNIKHAYHIMCLPCSRKDGICSKCSVKLADPLQGEESGNGENIDQIIKALPERKRRTLLRYLNKQNENKKNKNKKATIGDEKDKNEDEEDKIKEDILSDKINKLKLDAMSKDIEDYNSDEFGSEFDSEEFSDEDDDD